MSKKEFWLGMIFWAVVFVLIMLGGMIDTVFLKAGLIH